MKSMICFGKSGLMIITGEDGKVYYFNPELTLKQASDFIYGNENLSSYQSVSNEGDGSLTNKTEVFYVDPPERQSGHRLRTFEPLLDDNYYSQTE